uniref:Ycf13 n=1 Tax=Trachelomonas volvocina TaxID=103340 RepID=A0A0G3VQZ8_9EUGL|nr:Ycf13 [Trachelomonas volvocina]AKL82467.1 Ycf13 [Trachelomonas volvocina]
MILNGFIPDNFDLPSWDKSFRELFRLQLRLYKCFFVQDTYQALYLQKLILSSKSVRLLAIRDITQLDVQKRVAGIDGKLVLSFTERFLVSEDLKSNLNNWYSSVLKRVKMVDKSGSVSCIYISTVSDRCWQCIVKYSLEPAHDAFFLPRNLGYRPYISVHHLQKLFLLKLSKASYGYEKRVVCIDVKPCFNKFEYYYLLNKLLIPRSVKLGIFRLFNLGFVPIFYNSFLKSLDFSSLLANIILDGSENIHSSIRFGYQIVFFLKPLDNEFIIYRKLKYFLSNIGLDFEKFNISLSSAYLGFDFMGWNFKVSSNGNCIAVPSHTNYQNFLQRVKLIINNSNFGSDIKVSKLIPIIEEWKLYHRFSDFTKYKFSLFFVKKRAYKIFKKESKHDAYSAKKLVKKIFDFNYAVNKMQSIYFITLKGNFSFVHKSFWFDYWGFNTKKYDYFCVYCGIFRDYF